MEEIFIRYFENLWERPSGSMRLRFIFQPIVACLLAIRSGLRDAREGRSAFLMALIMNHGSRRDLISEAWKDVGKLFIMACILDIIFQLIELRWIYPLEMLTVAVLLAIIPYVIVRSLANWIARMFKK